MRALVSSTPRAITLSAVLLLGAACTVPSLKELEAERPRACDATHRCAEGYICVAGFCQSADETCTAGATRGCGTDVGECTVGAQSCTAAGTWGSCDGIAAVQEVCDNKDNDCDGTSDEEPQTNSCGVEQGVCAGKKKACISGSEEAVCSVLSFGGEFQPGGNETACDGKDNDCDGLTDESLQGSCGVDAGVCVGATQQCRGGGFFGCIAADFLARSAQYEAYEGKCDSLDNDCDGLTDTWSARFASDAGSLARKNVVAVAIPDAGTASQADVLAFYEEGQRVVMRQLFGDGRYNTPVFPAASVPAATRAYGPALATDGAALVAAWFDELPIAGGNTSYRLNVGLPRATGESFIDNSPGATPILQLTGPGRALHIVAAGGRIGIAWQWEDLTAGGGQKIGLANCPINLGTACATTTLTASAVAKPRLALSASGTEMWVVYENSTARSFVTKANYTTPGGIGTLTSLSPFSFTSDNEGSPWVFFNQSGLRLFFTARSGLITDRMRLRTCGLPCSTAANLGGGIFDVISATAAISNLALADNGTMTLAAFDQQSSPTPEIVYAAAGVTTKTGVVANGAGTSFINRAWPVFTTRGGNASFTVLYEADNGTQTVPAVMMRRFCGP